MTDRGSELHLDHLFKVGVLLTRARKPYPPAVRSEASNELLRYRDEGLNIQKERDMANMTVSGFCAFESPGSHAQCSGDYYQCSCECHKEQKAFSGKGILFAVIDDREAMRMGRVTTIDIIADAIESALDAGKETSEEIARYLTTSAFQHIRDKRVRFNSVLKAGDTVGAQITKKLHNSYNELAEMGDDAKGAEKATLEAEARGFAEAMQIVLSPFTAEDPADRTLVSWDEVDHMTELFEEEQRAIRAARKKRR